MIFPFLFHLSPWVIAAITGVEVSVVDMEVSIVDLEDRSKRKSIRWMNSPGLKSISDVVHAVPTLARGLLASAEHWLRYASFPELFCALCHFVSPQ